MKNSEKKIATIFDLAQMCKSAACSNCPIYILNNGYRVPCMNFWRNHTEEANNKILNWLEEEKKKNKVKTYMDDFFEKFPNAAREHDGTPKTCVRNIYPELEDKVRCYHQSCKACWNKPYEEEN